MTKKKKIRVLIISLILLALIVFAVVILPSPEKHESIKDAMRDAVLHNENKVNFFGIPVDPSLISGYVVTAILLVFAAILRILVIPRFKAVPGKLQLVIETWVGFFHDLAKGNSPHRFGALGAYIFGAGTYIFVGTMFELFGFQAVTTAGHSISLPAPLANINGAICMGLTSYLFIMIGGIAGNGAKGVALTLKEFSLPVSMSFRLFGALLSGMLPTELVYYYIMLSFGLPVVVGVMFTVIHALIQAYVLTMLTSFYYGEVSEVHHKKAKEESKESEDE
ncbi:MAG: F0F1 ATP synthase subunit A [Lachnospiraceae bacterium]|nr:F0F1 ATP synthase subunit A [Lachnospiraceae bacterium]